MHRWGGKVAVVTGASSGIGAAVARDLVKAGMQVVGLARRVERVESIAKELSEETGKLYAIKCDVTKEDEIKTAFNWVKDSLGGLDVLVNNAGVLKYGPIITEENNSDALRSVMETNIWGLCICTREGVLSMKERKVAGHVININSILGHKVMDQLSLGLFFNVYPASKYAVTALTEILRQELIHLDTKIKVTSICPGLVDTELIDEANYESNVPLLQPEDVSNAILYALGTPEHVQIHELVIKPIGERL